MHQYSIKQDDPLILNQGVRLRTVKGGKNMCVCVCVDVDVDVDVDVNVPLVERVVYDCLVLYYGTPKMDGFIQTNGVTIGEIGTIQRPCN